MTTSIISPIESGAQYIQKMARSFLFVGILNIICGIILTIIGWPVGLFSVVVGVIELINASLFWSTPPKRNSAPMYVAVFEIVNIISLGTLWSPILGINNLIRFKSPEVQAFFTALQRGEIMPNDRGLLKTTGQYKKCLKCAEPIQLDAVICRYCGYQFNEDDVKQAKELAIFQANKLNEQIIFSKLQRKRKNRMFWGWFLVSIGSFFFLVSVLTYLFPIQKEVSKGSEMKIEGLLGSIIIFVIPLISWGLFLFKKSKSIKTKMDSKTN